MEQEKIIRQLVIRSFHVTDISFSREFALTRQIPSPSVPLWKLSVNPDYLKELTASDPLIEDLSLQLISPQNRHIAVNSIMDIIPVSAKVTGKIGEGVTHTLTGVYVILTGADTAGNQICAFGNSNGWLDEQLVTDRPGTPGKNDFLLGFQVILKEKAGFSRSGPDAAHRACDLFCDQIRSLLKAKTSRDCTEKQIYRDVIRPGKKKVAIVKLVSGQGAMYDTRFLGKEPSSFEGSRSVIDIAGAPMILSPNEYRDGAIRAMY